MMISTMKRMFVLGTAFLPDPGGGMSPEQVKQFYSAIYPEITSAEIVGPTDKGDTLEYTFKKAVGTKG